MEWGSWYKIDRFSDSRLIVCLCFKGRDSMDYAYYSYYNLGATTCSWLVIIVEFFVYFRIFFLGTSISGNVSVDSCLDSVAEVFLSFIFEIFQIYLLSNSHIISSLFKGVQNRVSKLS